MILDRLKTNLVHGNVEYTVLLPPGYDKTSEPLPLLLNMHGGGLDRSYLAEPETRAMYEKLWAEGTLPPMVVRLLFRPRRLAPQLPRWHREVGRLRLRIYAIHAKNLQHKSSPNPQLPHRHLHGRHGFFTPNPKIPQPLWRSSRDGRRNQPSI